MTFTCMVPARRSVLDKSTQTTQKSGIEPGNTFEKKHLGLQLYGNNCSRICSIYYRCVRYKMILLFEYPNVSWKAIGINIYT